MPMKLRLGRAWGALVGAVLGYLAGVGLGVVVLVSIPRGFAPGDVAPLWLVPVTVAISTAIGAVFGARQGGPEA